MNYGVVCGTLPAMTNEDYLQTAHVAAVTAAHASDVRATHRKRSARGNLQRERDIQMALNRIREAMKPVRAELARIPYELRRNDNVHHHSRLEEQREQLLAISDALQRERRKLWKMQDRK